MVALAITLCREMPVRKVAKMLGVSDEAVWRVVDRQVETARSKEDFSGVRVVGVDETACRRGQHYISLFQDLDEPRVLYGCEGRDQWTVGAFAADLKTHGGDPEGVEVVCMDMSKAYMAGVARFLPNAEITFDKFHVVKLLNEAVDEVRRAEVKNQPCLKRAAVPVAERREQVDVGPARAAWSCPNGA